MRATPKMIFNVTISNYVVEYQPKVITLAFVLVQVMVGD